MCLLKYHGSLCFYYDCYDLCNHPEKQTGFHVCQLPASHDSDSHQTSRPADQQTSRPQTETCPSPVYWFMGIILFCPLVFSDWAEASGSRTIFVFCLHGWADTASVRTTGLTHLQQLHRHHHPPLSRPQRALLAQIKLPRAEIQSAAVPRAKT